MKYNCENIIQRYISGEQMEFILFWGHTMKPGKMRKACFSQWFPIHFTVNGVEYCCSEQYMMAQKALLFGDQVTFEKIMATDQASEIKALGREVRNFDEEKWNANKYQIVLSGNIAKFSQNEALREFLLGTGNAVIAEASPYDGIWGIRLGLDDPKAKDPRNWNGENLLGFAIMETRDILEEM